jgi:hypothetical protein
MIIEGNKIWFFVADLQQYGIQENTVKVGMKRNRQGVPTWRHKSHELDKRIKLIDYDYLPEATKSKLPSREDILKIAVADNAEKEHDHLQDACAILADLHKQNCLTRDFWFYSGKVLDKRKATDLMHAAGWLRLLDKYHTPKETRAINFPTKKDLRTAVVNLLLDNAKKAKSHLYGFKVTNVAVLQKKELKWSNRYSEALEFYSNEPVIEREKKAEEAALDTLLHDNFGNNNRRILGALNPDPAKRIMLPSGKIDFSEWNARTLLFLFMNPGRANKYDFENLYRRYQFECKKENREAEVEISAVKKFLTSNEVAKYVKRERHGWAELDKMLPHVYGAKYKYSLSKGGYDGFQVDFNSKIEGKQFMLTVVAVFDYMSEAVTGFDIGLVEDGLMVRNMYRNHLNLMGGRSFMEIESDRFSGNLTEDTRSIFEKTCQHISQPVPNDPEGKAPNPKSRFVERLIQEFNRLTQNVPGWKGTNITSIDKNRKPNPDYRSGNYIEGYAESVKQIIDLINIYNNDTYNRSQSRIDVCLNNINPDAPEISRENIAILLNQSTIVTVRNAKISFEVNRRVYEYAFPEYDLHVHKMFKGYKVKVYYDETDMSTVDVFGDRDAYIATLGKLNRISRAKVEQTSEDLRGLGEMVNNRKKMIDRIQEPTRKMLEFEASQFGLDISNMTMQEAKEVLAGMKEINYEDLFADALATPNAKVTANYYGDRILRANGESVPVSKADKKGLEDQRRELEREKAKRKGII